MAKIGSTESGKVTLLFGFSLHYKKASSAENKKILADVYKSAFNETPKFEYVLDKSLADFKTTSEPVKNTDGLTTISNIFGGAEVLESWQSHEP